MKRPASKGDVKLKFGSAVKAARHNLGISQEELAGRAGLHRTYVADIERGARNVSLESIDKLANALELSVSALFHSGAEGTKGNGAGLVDILLVEDDANDIELSLEAFRRANFTNPIHVVNDGQSALDFVFCKGAYTHRDPDRPPDMILLDLCLPRVGGVEVLRQIKSDEHARKIPVVVLTASRMERDIEECRGLGAATYIVKPVDFQNFSEVTPHFQLRWALLSPPAHASATR